MTGRDIEVLYVRVGPVTGIATIWRPPSWLQPRATTLAQPVVVPYLPHALLPVVTSLMPRWARDAVISRIVVELSRKGPNAEGEIKKARRRRRWE